MRSTICCTDGITGPLGGSRQKLVEELLHARVVEIDVPAFIELSAAFGKLIQNVLPRAQQVHGRFDRCLARSKAPAGNCIR